jgi:tRNA(Ile)-lysidine synthase
VSISKSEAPGALLLNRLPAASHYCVAFSGGVDSHVLLHMMASLGPRTGAALSAVHVNHGLQVQAAEWAQHCRAVCEELCVTLATLGVDASPRAGESPEAAARRARYRALAQWLPADAVLVTAQHREDQAETLLLQLFRGAGPRGLAAMPQVSPFGAGRLARPLLAQTRAGILAYARHHRLQWVEDPSNADVRYDRNLLRHRVMPLVRQRWSGIDRALARAAELQADQAQLAATLAQQDITRCGITGHSDQLHCAPLRDMTRARRNNLLRHWLEINALPLPARAVLDRIADSVLDARDDANPLLTWPGAEVRRYGESLYAMPPLPPHDGTARFTWNIDRPLALPGGVLGALPCIGGGLRVGEKTSLEVRFRRGGEVLRPAGRQGRHALKKLFQEWRVPPWERARVPLLFIDGELAAVAGRCVCAEFEADSGEAGYELCWQTGTAA